MSAEITFTTGFAITDTAFWAAGAGDVLDDFEPFTRIVQYYEEHPPHWWHHDQDWRACAITYFGPASEDFDDAVVLSEEGHVRYIGAHPPLLEKIPGAGVYSEDAKNWGYLADIQQIGEHLYACGYCGQVYKRFGAGDWRHVDDGLLQAPDTAMHDSIALSVINGAHENAIYTAGYQHAHGLPPKLFFYNGQHWREIALPEVAERIVNMYVENESRIWLCGANGTLLLGNANEAFRSLSSIEDNQLFTSLCKFQEKIYLASNMGLFLYDPRAHERGIEPVHTDLTPDLQDANIVDCYDKVLWSIGSKDVARFDGKTWQRLQHPDNQKIGI